MDETSIYDINGNASPASQSGTNNKADLTQSTGLIITNVAIDTDYTTLTVTFNEAVYNTATGSGNLDVNDFSLSISEQLNFQMVHLDHLQLLHEYYSYR